MTQKVLPREVAPAAALSPHVIFVRYVVFAVAAGVANLGCQALVGVVLPGWPLMISVLAGTAVGFFAKYLLDKKWVFDDGYDGHAAEVRKVVVYGLSGVGTTVLFWAVELGCWRLWQTSTAKYAGAVIGLSLGNWIKYLLDKQFVFSRDRQ